MGGTSEGKFVTTRWTLVGRAGTDADALAELVRVYDAPLRGWLARRGIEGDQADEVLSGFVATVVVERKLFERADEARGRLRGLICLALSQYLAERWRTERKHASNEPIERASNEVGEGESVERAFDRAWAAETIGIAIGRCRDECKRSGLDEHWVAFERRVLRPALDGGTPPSLSAIAAELGIEDETTLSSRILTTKRVFRRCLRQTVADTVLVSAAGDIEREERYLLELLRG